MRSRSLIVALIFCGGSGLHPRRADASASGQVSASGAARTTAPHRVVSLVPATSEMLFAMGAGGRVAGVSSYDRYPPEVDRLPRVGGLLDPNLELILTLKPDLVILYDTQNELKRQLERAGIPIFPYAHRGLPDITQTMRALGARMGLKAAADAAADRIERRLEDIRSRVAGRPRVRTLLVFGREPGSLSNIDASGGYGFLHDMLEIAGGRNVLGDINRQSVQMGTEMVLARAPDVILELHYGSSPTASGLDGEWHVWNALPAVPAVSAHRVYLLFGDEFVVPGPRIAEATERVARTLHPEVWR